MDTMKDLFGEMISVAKDMAFECAKEMVKAIEENSASKDEDKEVVEEQGNNIEILKHTSSSDKEVLVLNCGGYDKEALSVELNVATLIVRAKAGGEWELSEKVAKFTISNNIDTTKMDVFYKNGALEIVLPKKEKKIFIIVDK